MSACHPFRVSPRKRQTRRKGTPRASGVATGAAPHPRAGEAAGQAQAAGQAPGAGAPPQGQAAPNGSGTARWQSVRPAGRQGMSFSLRIMISFIITALVTAVILVLVLRMELQGQFYAYTRASVEELAEVTAQALASGYVERGSWDEEQLKAAVDAYVETGDFGVQVLSTSGRVLYEAAEPGGALAGMPISLTIPASPDALVEVPVSVDDRQVGIVRVWTFGQEPLLTDSAQSFLNNTYLAVALAAGAAILLAWLIGAILARQLARPITRITNTARAIRNGDLTARTGLKGTDEVGELGETFDDMAASLEADLRTEHRLTSDVAHELRTPLMSIIVNVEAMQDGVLPADTEHLELVAGETRRLSRLVDAMLRLSRIENGTTPVNAELTDIAELVTTLVANQEQLFADQGLELRFRLDAPRQQVWANVDRDLMRQAVVNLLSNAMRYTPEGGSVEVSVGQDRDDVIISVADTGIGIEKEDLERVFTRFWRSDASRERDSGGLGVGLSLVREIVLRHNGFVTVESEPGRGSTFSIHVPRYHGRTPSQKSG